MAAKKKASASKTTSTSKKKAASEPSGADQRKHPRVDLDFLVQVRTESIEQFKELYGKNISLGGMFIQTPTPKPVGVQVYFQFTVKDGGTLIEGLGKVVHVSQGAPLGMGIEFVSVLEPSASIIRALVDARLQN